MGNMTNMGEDDSVGCVEVDLFENLTICSDVNYCSRVSGKRHKWMVLAV